jgi:hypothetical protein
MERMAKQRGLSLMGFLFWGILIAFFAVIGFRVVPVYIEYFTVKKIMQNVLRDSDGNNAMQIRNSFDLKTTADYVDSVHGKDLEISKEGGHVYLTATWAKKISLFGNVSLVLDFDASVQK